MAPRVVQIGMAVFMVALGWVSSWRHAAPPAATELARLTERAMAAVAEQEGTSPAQVRVREVEPVSASTRLCACGTPTTDAGVPMPGYHLVLVANNVIYEYHGAGDCIVPVLRALDGRTTERGPGPTGRVLAQGNKVNAVQPARPLNIWQSVGAEEQRALAIQPFRMAGTDSFYRLHLGYSVTPVVPAVAALARPMP